MVTAMVSAGSVRVFIVVVQRRKGERKDVDIALPAALRTSFILKILFKPFIYE